jgi:hypothetical protein
MVAKAKTLARARVVAQPMVPRSRSNSIKSVVTLGGGLGTLSPALFTSGHHEELVQRRIPFKALQVVRWT